MDCMRLRSLSIVESPTGIVAFFTGSLTSTARPSFTLLLAQITPESPSQVVLDLTATEHLDESGVALLQALAEAAGACLEIRVVPGVVAQVLGHAGLACVLVPSP